MLTFHVPATSKPFEDIIGDVSIVSTAEPDIGTFYDVPWSSTAAAGQTHLRIGAADAGNLLGGSFTFGLWVTFNQSNTQDDIASWYNNTSDRSFLLRRMPGRTIRLETYHASSESTLLEIGGVAVPNRPLFISWSFNGLDHVRLQAGSKFDSFTLPGSPLALLTATPNLNVGRWVGQITQLNGAFRDWMIWDEVLSDRERVDVYRRGLWTPETCRAGARGWRSSVDSTRTVCNPGL